MVELKAGMMALIIDSPFNENLGRVVTVDCFVGEHTSQTGTTKQECWSVFAARDPLVGVDHETGEICGFARGVIPGKWLMPIVNAVSAEGYVL